MAFNNELKLYKPDLEFVQRNQSVKILALRVFRKTQSSASVTTYVQHLRFFFKWLGMEPDQAKDFKFDWTGKINEYLDLLVSKGKAPRTILNALYSIKKWCIVNNIEVDWSQIDTPKAWKLEQERLPSKEELREILKGGDLTDKVLVTCLLSSGMRIGALLKLKLRDIDFNYDCPVVKVPARLSKTRMSYITFFSKECKEFIQLYLKEREMRGEKLTPESYLIVREGARGLPLSSVGAVQRWHNLLKRTGLNSKGRTRYHLHIHVLRKYFKSWVSLSGIPEPLVELFMGHKGGISQVYFLPDVESATPEIIKRLLSEYTKALPALTIFSDESKIKELESKIQEQAKLFEEEKRKHEEEKKRLEEERKYLEERVKRLEKLVEQMIALRKRMIIETN